MKFIKGVLEILDRQEQSPMECLWAIVTLDSSSNLMLADPEYEPITEEELLVRRILIPSTHLARLRIAEEEWSDLVPIFLDAIRTQIEASLDPKRKGETVPEVENVWSVMSERKKQLADSGRFPPDVVLGWYEMGYF